MIGAIAGDIAGSVHEFTPVTSEDFALFSEESFFTDDTVLSVVIARWLLDGHDLTAAMHDAYEAFPGAGWGGMFANWARTRSRAPYGSYGNGSAMRAAPVGWAFESLDEVLDGARRSAEVTHDHPEGIKGAQATAAAIFIARTGGTAADVQEFISGPAIGYDLDRKLSDVRAVHRFDETCQGSVPEAILCALQADDFEGALRNAISLGGDADTQACIAGGIAEALHGLPHWIRDLSLSRLPPDMREVLRRFTATFPATG